MSPPNRIVITLASVCIIIAALKIAAPILTPIALALLIAGTCAPLVNRLAARGIAPMVGAVAVTLLELGALALVVFLLTFAVKEVQGSLAHYAGAITALTAHTQDLLSRLGLPAEHASPQALSENLLPVLSASFGRVLAATSDLGVILLVVLFTLAEFAVVGEKIQRLAPAASRAGFQRVDSVIRDVQKYLLVKLLTSTMAGVLAFVTLKLLGVGLALPLAIAMFLLHFIPNIGALLATIPAILVALLDRGGVTAGAVAAIYFLGNTIIGNVIEPKILGRTLGVSALVVLLSMLFWSWVWGPVGALLSVPIAVVAKAVLEQTPYAWAAKLIDPVPATELSDMPQSILGHLRAPFSARSSRRANTESLGLGLARPDPTTELHVPAGMDPIAVQPTDERITQVSMQRE
jgi:AI-2 transport protein TqsA